MWGAGGQARLHGEAALELNLVDIYPWVAGGGHMKLFQVGVYHDSVCVSEDYPGSITRE